MKRAGAEPDRKLVDSAGTSASASCTPALPAASDDPRTSTFIDAVSASMGEGGDALASSPPPPAVTSEGPVLPGRLAQQCQGLFLQPRLLGRRQPHDPFDLAWVERVLPQVSVPQEPALQRAEALQQQRQ